MGHIGPHIYCKVNMILWKLYFSYAQAYTLWSYVYFFWRPDQKITSERVFSVRLKDADGEETTGACGLCTWTRSRMLMPYESLSMLLTSDWVPNMYFACATHEALCFERGWGSKGGGGSGRVRIKKTSCCPSPQAQCPLFKCCARFEKPQKTAEELTLMQSH